MPAQHEYCFWTQNRIEAYIDDELLDSELETFERHIEVCGRCREELSCARTITDGLHSLSTLHCPESVIESAAARAGVSSHRTAPTRSENTRSWLRRFFNPAPIPAMALTLVVIVTASLLVLRHDRTPVGDAAVTLSEGEVSQEDVDMVTSEVALAFSYVNKYSMRTGEVVKQGAILDRVMKSAYETVVESMSPFPINE